MNEMKDFDINKLDEYYEKSISFKLSDVVKWCNANKDNSNFDINYAANDLIDRYFSDGNFRTDKRCYFYIRYAVYSKHLYRIERDYIMSPLHNKNGTSSTIIKDMINRGNRLKNKIISDERSTNYEIETINKIEELYTRRIYTITKESCVDLTGYFKYNIRQKNAIWAICNDRLKDLQLVYFILRKIK